MKNDISSLGRLVAWCLAALLMGCSPQPRHYKIGVSQCSADIWREKENAELRMGAYFQDGVQLCFAAAYDSDERQVEQIDSLVASGIDLLIVAPNQVATISPAIDRAYDSGIPVIVFERKTNSHKFTAFMSADNYEMGRQMGEYIASRLKGNGQILEIIGLKGSSPAIERHKGFADAMAAYPQLHVAATLQGDWTEEKAYETTQQWLSSHPDAHIDLVFGANDRTAMGARKAFEEAAGQHGTSSQGKGLPLLCGIDGLPGPDGGIRLVRDSILEASYIYPTYGDRLLQLAVDILDGKPFKKEIRMQSAIVTRDNARVLLMQTEETMRQGEYLDQLHRKADNYLRELDTQRTITWLACGVIVLLLIVIFLFYIYRLGKINMQRERVVNTLWNLKPDDIVAAPEHAASAAERAAGSAEHATASAAPEQAAAVGEGPVSDAAEHPDDETPQTVSDAAPSTTAESSSDDDTQDSAPGTPVASLFITRFKEVVEARLENSELSVEDLAADMNLSRVQLYRKVKTISGSTPVELLRTARLNRAYQLLLTTDRSVSEVAYQVGFTAPSYFTKCFKEEYGMLPGDVRN